MPTVPGSLRQRAPSPEPGHTEISEAVSQFLPSRYAEKFHSPTRSSRQNKSLHSCRHTGMYLSAVPWLIWDKKGAWKRIPPHKSWTPSLHILQDKSPPPSPQCPFLPQ